MQAVLLLHIVAGALGLASGFVALYASKGAALHRRAGLVFACTMLAMTSSATLLEIVHRRSPATNIPGALLTAYLVVTGLGAVRPLAGGRRLQLAAMVAAFGVGFVSLAFGFEAIAQGGKRNGMPAFPFFLFGVVGVLGGALDVRMLRAGGLRGAARLARHLWRLCTALLIAAMSFFLGQADEIPAVLRIPALLAAPVVAVPVALFYWLWRVLGRRPRRGFVQTARAS